MPPSVKRTQALTRLQELIGILPTDLRLAVSAQLTLLVQSQELDAAQKTLQQELEVWILSYLPDIQRIEGTAEAQSLTWLQEAKKTLDASYASLGVAANNNEGTPEEQLDKLRQQVFALFDARHKYDRASESVCAAEADFAPYIARWNDSLEQLRKIFRKYTEACS